LLSDNTVIVARETKSQSVNLAKRAYIELPYILADNALVIEVFVANVPSVCVAGIRVVVSCPLMGDSVVRVAAFGACRPIGYPSGTAEQLSKSITRHFKPSSQVSSPFAKANLWLKLAPAASAIWLGSSAVKLPRFIFALKPQGWPNALSAQLG
jgi:hypothetical protein